MKLLSISRFTIIIACILFGIRGMNHNAQSQTVLPSLAQSPNRPHPDRSVDYLSIIGGATDAVYVQDNYAYIGVGMRMVVLDISEPQQPRKVGESGVLSGIVQDIVVVDTIAYVAASSGGLRIIDISAPTDPREIANVDRKGSTASVTIVDNRAYLAEDWNGFQVVDITDSTSPVVLGHYGELNAVRVIVQDTIAYVAAQANGLYLIDISDPANMAEISHMLGSTNEPLPAHVYDLQLIGNYALVAVDIADAAGGLLTIDVTEPANPVLLDERYTRQGRARRMIIANQIAYVLDSNQDSLHLLDVADYFNGVSSPAIRKISEISLRGHTANMSLAQNHIYVAARSAGLLIVDISNPQTPRGITDYKSINNVQAVDVVGAHAYLVGTDLGLAVVDISQPANPQWVSTALSELLVGTSDVQVEEQWAYIIEWQKKLHLVNVNDPQRPVSVDSLAPSDGIPLRVKVVGDRAYIANDTDGIWIVERASNRLTEVAQIPVIGDVKSLDVVVQEGQTLIYVANGEAGLKIIDVSDLENPKTVGSLPINCICLDIQVVDEKAYLVSPNEGLFIVDVADLTNLQILGELGTDSAGQPQRLHILGDAAFLASSWGGVRFVDITDPTNPWQMLRFSTVSSVRDVHVVGNLIYAATYNGGLTILQDSVDNPTPTPTAVQLLPTTTITATPTPPPTSTVAPTTVPTTVPTTTPIAVPTATPTATPSEIFTASPTPGDNPEGDPEDDNTCEQAHDFPLSLRNQERAFDAPIDQDWIRFEAIADTIYRVEVQIPPGSAADVDMEIYPDCDSVPDETWNATFAPGARIDFTAPTDGSVYLRLAPHQATAQDQDLRYELSIRALADEAPSGSVILLAGRYSLSDPLQSNIHNVTDRAFTVFQSQGYTAEDIYYLATDSSLTGYDAPATSNGLQAALLDWAAGRLTNGGVLTLYIMDHGDENVIYIDEPNGERIAPAQLDEWLTQLEANVPDDTLINVIIEACHSGSFIQGQESLSKEGRVIISSTNLEWDAYASQNGAYFSDHFLTALQAGRNLFNSFWGAKETVNHLYPWQQPWLDADGNGVPNELTDASIASQRGFAYIGTLASDTWPPYIVGNQAELTVEGRQGQLRVEVRDDRQVRTVWAVIYPPSYEPPANSAGELVSGDTDATILLQAQGDNVYTASYPGFDEVGVYKVVVHATDNDELAAQPKVLQVEVGHRVYLPLIQR